jgi:hypothetical protein
MEALSVVRINITAPYKVWNDGLSYRFETDYGVSYVVDFDKDDNPYFDCYWFNLTNPNHSKSPGDIKIAKTVICIIEEFFRQNSDVLLYMCSNENGQQAQRSRLFLRWFSGYEQQQRYFLKAVDIKGESADGKEEKDYVALIVQRTHPQLEEIIARFDSEVAMFNEFKP